MKITLEVVGEEPPRCHAQPSPHSTARCEMPSDHVKRKDATGGEEIHAGRTRAGYWKFWPVSKEEASA